MVEPIEPLENVYFNWLCAKVVDDREQNINLTYWKLLKKLHTTEFVWMLSGDDNRAEDGKELRTEFLLLYEIPDDPEWRELIGCSILEMLIAFSRRAGFMSGSSDKDWFWKFIENLGLTECDDGHINEKLVDDILEVFVWRTYEYDGAGGLFPLRKPEADQRDVEVWYQFCDYLVDKDILA